MSCKPSLSKSFSPSLHPASKVPATLLGGGAPSLLTAGLVAQYDFLEGSGNVAFNKAATSQVNPFTLAAAPEQNFGTNNALWQSANITVTDSVEANPVDGDVTASRAVSTNNTHYLYQGSFTLAAGTYTASLWVKSNTGATQKVSFLLNCGGFITSPDKDVTTSWTRITHTFTVTGGTGEFYILGYSDPKTAIDLFFYDARLESGSSVGSNTAPTLFHLELGSELNGGTDTTKPAWSVAGLEFASGGQKHLFGAGGPHSFSEMSVYVVCKRSGSPFFANYLPLINDLKNAGQTNAFSLAGMYNSYFPYFRFGAAANKVEAYGATLEDGNTHVLAATYDGSYLRIYLDGVEVERNNIGAVSALTVNRLFFSNFAFAAYWAGDIYYSLLYDVAHTREQVATQTDVLSGLMADRGITVNTIDKFVIFEGDSITSPRTSPTGDLMYPYKSLQAISPRPQGRNFAVPGSIIETGLGAPSLKDREAEVKASFVPGIRNVFFMADGHNDCNQPAFTSLYSDYIGRIRAYATANSIDLKIICATILPSTSPGLQTSIDSANAWIIANYATIGADYLCRFDTATDMGDASNVTYYSDGTHPTALGQTRIATSRAQPSIEAALA